MWLPLPGKSWGSEPPMKLVIGSDHAGFALKVAMGDLLRSLGHEVLDVGAFNENPSDYPDFAEAAWERALRRIKSWVFAPACVTTPIRRIRAWSTTTSTCWCWGLASLA